MSALGHKRTFGSAYSMSALPPIADIETQSRDVRFVPKADISFAHSIPHYDVRPPHRLAQATPSVSSLRRERSSRATVTLTAIAIDPTRINFNF